MITIQEFRKQIRRDISVRDFQTVLLICQRNKIKTMEQLYEYIKQNTMMAIEIDTGE